MTYVCLDCGNEQVQDYRCNECGGWTFESLINLALHYEWDKGHADGDPQRVGYKEAFASMKQRRIDKMIALLPTHPRYGADDFGTGRSFRVLEAREARQRRYEQVCYYNSNRNPVMEDLRQATEKGELVKMLVIENFILLAGLEFRPMYVDRLIGMIAHGEGKV